jgi:hypothetical protein
MESDPCHPFLESATAMNEDDLKLQAERVRALAAIADPFIRKRLLDLGRRYDERLRGKSWPHVTLANLPEQRVPEKVNCGDFYRIESQGERNTGAGAPE